MKYEVINRNKKGEVIADMSQVKLPKSLQVELHKILKGGIKI